MEFHKVVEVSEIGRMHMEGTRLIVGDLDILAMAVGAWGGGSQRGRVTITIELLPQTNLDSNPGYGKFNEPSETPMIQ